MIILPHEMTVEITEEDIRNGERGKCHACPIALAFTRSMKKILPGKNIAAFATLYGISFAVYDEGEECPAYVTHRFTPDDSSEHNTFILKFDADCTVSPFSITGKFFDGFNYHIEEEYSCE